MAEEISAVSATAEIDRLASSALYAAPKLYATETAFETPHESPHVHGGIGYTKELPIERYFRDSRFMMIGGVQLRS